MTDVSWWGLRHPAAVDGWWNLPMSRDDWEREGQAFEVGWRADHAAFAEEFWSGLEHEVRRRVLGV